MNKIVVCVLCSLLIFSCGNDKKAPDVSHIKVDLRIDRFDKDFFRLDSNAIPEGLRRLKAKYPAFYGDYMQGILGVSGNETDPNTQQLTRVMLSGYRSLYDAVESEVNDLAKQQRELKKAFQFVKYYFPEYKLPALVSFVGTLDAPGTILARQYIGIGLHQYAGKDFPGYQANEVKQLYPAYITRRFEQEYITANCMKAVVSDLFPDKSESRPLVLQMIEKGKQWWLLDRFLPAMADSLKTGYTAQQVKWCEDNEGLIWSYIVKNEDLYSVRVAVLQTYIGEAPFTPVFSQEMSPGNIGPWIGWQIVKAFEEKNPGMPLAEIMNTNAEQILEVSKYKPK